MAIDREDILKRAEQLLRQGRLDAAIPEYERLVEAFPHDWNTANTLGDLLVEAHHPERAAAQYCRIADHAVQEGFLPKAAALYRKALHLVPHDEHALRQSAEIAARQGTLVEARALLSTLAEARTARGDAAGAAEARLGIARLEPDDLDARLAAAAAMPSGSREAETELLALAGALEARGEEARALEVLAELLRRTPGDRALGTRLLRAHVARGDHEGALALADAMEDIDDSDLLFWVGARRAEGGRLDPARAAFARVLAREPHRCEGMVARAGELAAENPGAARVYLESAADVLVLRGEFAAAAAAYGRFAEREPQDVAALQRLAEICLDGNLHDELTRAQTMLVDALLAARRGTEARPVAEDLVARHPAEPEYVARLRQALEQAGESDVEAIIAARLSGSPPPAATERGATLQPAPGSPARTGADPFRLGPIAIDLHDILGDELEGPAGQQDGPDSPEIDLSAALDGLASSDATPQAGSASPAPPDLEEVFQEFRQEVSRDSEDEAAERHYKLGLTYRDMGMEGQAVKELEVAARSPRLRFEAGALLARLLNTLGQTRDAVEWFERAAEAPAPSAEEGRALLYELATALEATGETARALAVLLELQTTAADFRDVRRRIQRLSGQTGGG